MQLSIIIVNYNVQYFLEQCLYAVKKACANIEAEVLVVDNNSETGSIQFLKERFPGVVFIFNKINVGFARANNQALEMAKGEIVLFLNPDTIVPEDCFEQCLAFLAAHKNAGALGVHMIDGTGKFLKESKRAFPSPITSLLKLSGLANLFPRSRIAARYYLGHLPENETQEVDVLAGAFMMIPRNVLQQTGSFDERFFMYGEDVDLSYRIQKAGYKNYYFPGTSIIHFKGESTKKGSLNYVRLFYKAMSLFVQKHYSGSKAGIFNFLVQAAIWSKAILTVMGKFMQRIGLPLMDAVIILLSFWGVKYLWSTYIRQEVDYSPNMLVIAFPVYMFFFLIISYYCGLYDRGYKQSQLNRSMGVATLFLLSGYALLPEDLRFSRGILVFGIAGAFMMMSLMRRLFLNWRLLDDMDEDEERRQTIIVASQQDFDITRALMQEAGMRERVLGRVHHNDQETGVLGSIDALPDLLQKYPVKEVIYCEDGISFKKIIHTIQHLPLTVRNKFHASGSNSIIGSDSKDVSGDYVAANKKFVIGLPLNRRNKRLLDTIVALILLFSFPVHLLLQKKRARFFENTFNVLLGKKSWVGYASPALHLPPLTPGVLTSTSLPASLNTLPNESLQISDEWYASEYTVSLDIQKIMRRYQYLGN